MKLLRAVQRDQATIRARDTRIAALKAELESSRHRQKVLLARAVVTHRIHKRTGKTLVTARTRSTQRRTKRKREMTRRMSRKPKGR